MKKVLSLLLSTGFFHALFFWAGSLQAMRPVDSPLTLTQFFYYQSFAAELVHTHKHSGLAPELAHMRLGYDIWLNKSDLEQALARREQYLLSQKNLAVEQNNQQKPCYPTTESFQSIASGKKTQEN